MLDEARKKSGDSVLAGHDIMALERFGEDTRHMIVFDVLSHSSPVGDKGERMRLFLTDAGYQKAMDSQSRKEIKIVKHAKVVKGDITLENIYTLLANFDKVYDKISDEEKKSLISSLIKEIEIFPCDESELPLKSILFNFPVYKDGGDV